VKIVNVAIAINKANVASSKRNGASGCVSNALPIEWKNWNAEVNSRAVIAMPVARPAFTAWNNAIVARNCGISPREHGEPAIIRLVPAQGGQNAHGTTAPPNAGHTRYSAN